MKTKTDYWKHWWNEQARHASSDYVLNRRTNFHLAVLEQKALQQFINAVNPQVDDVILDAGCGSGRNIALLAPMVKQVVGVDYSDQMIQRAQERVSTDGLSNVKLIEGAVTKLEFPANSFNKVVCASVLQYLDDENCALAIREMIRVCKPGGTLVIHAKNGTSLYGLSLKCLRPIARLIGRQMKPEYYRSRRWHERTVEMEGGVQVDYDGFGILTFVPLPQWAVGCLLRCEMSLPSPKFLRKLAVNYKITVRVQKK